MKILKMIKDKDNLVFTYLFINLFALFSFLFDYAVTFSVVKYDYQYFIANEQSSSFVGFVNGDLFGAIIILILNLALLLPFVFIGRWFIKQDLGVRNNKTNFFAFVNCGVLSLVVGSGHIYGGMSWL